MEAQPHRLLILQGLSDWPYARVGLHCRYFCIPQPQAHNRHSNFQLTPTTQSIVRATTGARLLRYLHLSTRNSHIHPHPPSIKRGDISGRPPAMCSEVTTPVDDTITSTSFRPRHRCVLKNSHRPISYIFPRHPRPSCYHPTGMAPRTQHLVYGLSIQDTHHRHWKKTYMETDL